MPKHRVSIIAGARYHAVYIRRNAAAPARFQIFRTAGADKPLVVIKGHVAEYVAGMMQGCRRADLDRQFERLIGGPSNTV